MITISDVSYNYDKTTALKDINLEVARGELFGLIGADGAGKTTLLRLVMTLLNVQKGRISMNNWDVMKDYRKIRQFAGYMPGRFSLYPDLSVEENLQFFASVFGTTIKKSYPHIKKIYSQIEPFKHRKAGRLSGGMKQKLALSCAMVHKPQVLILDEPTTGVDAVSRSEFWEIIREFKKEGITIMVSTPYMDEASLCDRIGLMHNGQILRKDIVSNLVNDYNGNLFAVRTQDKQATLQNLRKLKWVDSVQVFGQELHLTTSLDHQEVLEQLNQTYITDVHISPETPNVEDVFIQLAHQQHE